MNVLSDSLLFPAPMQEIKGVQTFVTKRHNGSSKGAYASFNCSPYSGDDWVCVSDNTSKLRSFLGDYSFPLILPKQVHGTVVRCVDSDFLGWDSQRQHIALEGVDALITDSPFCALCVSTADCLPVFFYDPMHRVIGIAHSGWRGTVNHIVLHTLQALQQVYGSCPKDIQMAFGPCISQSAFEVGDEVYEAFHREGFSMKQIAFRNPQTGKWHISLQEAVREDALSFGVNNLFIEQSSHCTYTECEDFFSARRLGIHSGRILSGLFLSSL